MASDPVPVLEPGTGQVIPQKSTASPASGIGTGGGATTVDTSHVLKDAAQGGALPDTQEGLDAAVRAKHLDNEQAMTGSLVLAEAMPELSADQQVLLQGLGPVFSGVWTIQRHTLTVDGNGVTSTLDVTRNALGPSDGPVPSSGFPVLGTDQEKPLHLPSLNSEPTTQNRAGFLGGEA